MSEQRLTRETMSIEEATISNMWEIAAIVEDLGELSANPVRLFGSFSVFGLFGSFCIPISQPNERDKLNKPVLVLLNQTNQIDQINEINRLRSRPENRRILIQQLNLST